MKNFITTFFSSFFKTVATILGVICALAALIIGLSPSSVSSPSHNFEMAPDHNWEIKPFSKTTPTILKINILGAIGQNITSADLKKILFDSLESEIGKEQIKGILLNIDSPGGTASDSDTIYRFLKEYKKRYNTPIYAYVDGLCASGGFMIACAADKLLTTESSLIGSIGVIVPTAFNVSGLMEKLGIQSLTVSSGKSKDSLNPFRPWTADEAQNIQLAANSYYERFLEIATQNRSGLTKQELIDQGAEIYPATIALQKHLIDGCVNLESDVLLQLAQDLHIDHEYQVVEFSTENWIKSLFNEESPLKKEVQITVPGTLPQKLQGKFLYLYHPES